MIKRTIDILLATGGLFFFLPFILFACIMLACSGAGGVFYRQQRIGLKGEKITVFKFCTLYNEKPRSWFALLLRKTALDELPQLLNILRGEMSFVGPRPLVEREVAQATEKDRLEQRLSLPPGLTGVSQLFLSKNAPIEQKITCDLWYRSHQNVFLDIFLLCLSIFVTGSGNWDGQERSGILRKAHKMLCFLTRSELSIR